MAAKKGQEIATIDVAMVTLTTKDGIELGLKTSTQVGVSSQIETTEAIKLIVKGTLIAQKRQKSIITGNSITMKDNVFNPQLVQILQGGVIEYNEDNSFKKYTPVVSGEDYSPDPFTLSMRKPHILIVLVSLFRLNLRTMYLELQNIQLFLPPQKGKPLIQLRWLNLYLS